MLLLNPPQPLHAQHDISIFNCGKEPLNEFLRLHALDKQNAMLSRTYVITQENRVFGYYTLAHISIVQSEAPKRLGRGMPNSIPAILMARFALDVNMQGQGLGRSLFVDALRRTWAVIQSGAAPVRFFVVDAKDEDAKRFYERFDMIPSPQNSMRLYLSYKTLKLAFGEPGNHSEA